MVEIARKPWLFLNQVPDVWRIRTISLPIFLKRFPVLEFVGGWRKSPRSCWWRSDFNRGANTLEIPDIQPTRNHAHLHAASRKLQIFDDIYLPKKIFLQPPAWDLYSSPGAPDKKLYFLASFWMLAQKEIYERKFPEKIFSYPNCRN